MIKEEQDKMFDNFKIPEYHKFFSKKMERINPKSLMRISSEFSSMKTEPSKQLGYEHCTTCIFNII